jgi:hypothetical protein
MEAALATNRKRSFRAKGRRDCAIDLGRGGSEFPGPWGVSVSRNITSGKSKSIGDWIDVKI